MSLDAWVKFIEDDFLDSARLDPATDGRPDPRISVRESLAQVGNVTSAFDFSQQPRSTVLLPTHPKTDLIEPGSVGHHISKRRVAVIAFAVLVAVGAVAGAVVLATRRRRPATVAPQRP
jgi:hypothetical protein